MAAMRGRVFRAKRVTAVCAAFLSVAVLSACGGDPPKTRYVFRKDAVSNDQIEALQGNDSVQSLEFDQTGLTDEQLQLVAGCGCGDHRPTG